MIESKMGILTLSALLNTLKIPVNGYSDKKVKWQNGISMDELESKSVKIQLEFKNATIYSFSFKK